MPTRNFSKRRRSSRSKRRFRGTNTEIIHKPIPRITTINKKVKRVMDMIELKYSDVLFNAAVDDTGDLQLLNGIDTGTSGFQDRVGNEIVCTSIQMRGTITTDSTSLSSEQQVRVILFWYQQANGIAPTLAGAGSQGAGTDALLNNGTVTNLINAPYMYEYNRSYRVLYDKRIILNAGAISSIENNDSGVANEVLSYASTSKLFKRKIKLNRKTKYDQITGTISSISTNALYMAVMSSESAQAPTVNIGFRLYFKDA